MTSRQRSKKGFAAFTSVTLRVVRTSNGAPRRFSMAEMRRDSVDTGTDRRAAARR
ncbi:MAG: hypothetical protein R3E48_22095 [Burkholderiaceae bacterium]